MNDSADLRFLLTLRESGSLIAAARKLVLSPSTITQRRQQLEKKLGAQRVKRMGMPEPPDELRRSRCLTGTRARQTWHRAARSGLCRRLQL